MLLFNSNFFILNYFLLNDLLSIYRPSFYFSIFVATCSQLFDCLVVTLATFTVANPWRGGGGESPQISKISACFYEFIQTNTKCLIDAIFQISKLVLFYNLIDKGIALYIFSSFDIAFLLEFQLVPT